MDSDRPPFVIRHIASPPVDLGHMVATLEADIRFHEPFDLRFMHVEVV